MKNQHNFIFSVYIQFLAYDSKDEVVRYSLTSLIKDQLDDSDPCQSVNCPRNSFCIILESNSQNAQCQCNQGFISMGTSSGGSDTQNLGRHGTVFKNKLLTKVDAPKNQLAHENRCIKRPSQLQRFHSIS